MHSKSLIAACVASALLGACAAAPRAPATTLADAGIKATTSFSAEVGEVAEQLDYISVTEAFSRTWDLCINPALCQVSTEKESTSKARQDLANVVTLRSQAIDALGAAYAALKTEAAYDGGADLQDATGKALTSVTAFADAAAKAAGAPALPSLSQPIQGLIGFGAKLVGEKRQRDRLFAANKAIGAAALRLRDGLRYEADIFAGLAEYVVDKRTAVREAFFESGLTPPSSVLADFARPLDVEMVSNTEAIIDQSPRLRTAVRATLKGMSQLEARRMAERYRLSIAALTALVRSHEAFAARQPTGIADVERLLDQLDASLAPITNSGAQP